MNKNFNQQEKERTQKVDLAGAPASQPTELENEIAQIWGELLGREDVGLDESFLKLGGSSLQVIQLKGILDETYDISLSMMTILTRGLTVRNLAHLVEDLLLEGIDFSNLGEAIEKLKEPAGFNTTGEKVE